MQFEVFSGGVFVARTELERAPTVNGKIMIDGAEYTVEEVTHYSQSRHELRVTPSQESKPVTPVVDLASEATEEKPVPPTPRAPRRRSGGNAA